MPLPAHPDVVRLGDVTDIAAAVPHLLGFRPTDSLVAVALRRPRDRMTFTMRIDLPRIADDVAAAADIAIRMRHAKADAVLLFVYTGRGRRSALPRRALVRAVSRALDVPVRDALLVDDDRVWSYLCDDARCCPPTGRKLDPASPGATALAAAHALNGGAVLPDRDALVATTAAVRGIAAASMSQAQDRAVTRLLEGGPAALDVDVAVGFVDGLCGRYDDPPVQLAHDEAAEVALRFQDLRVRDLFLQRAARGEEAVELLIRDVAHLAQPPDDAPVAAMLALCAYLRGEGVVAIAAAERALATDPDYSLAGLVCECVQRQLDPAQARRLWAAGAGSDDLG